VSNFVEWLKWKELANVLPFLINWHLCVFVGRFKQIGAVSWATVRQNLGGLISHAPHTCRLCL